MDRSSLPCGLSTLKKWREAKGVLSFSLAFQRHTGMWSLAQKSMLVWSLLSDSYIPPLVFVKEGDVADSRGKQCAAYSVLDGLQRLSSLFGFMNDEFRLHGSTPDVEADGEAHALAGLLFSELPQELRNLVNSYKFSIQVIANATEGELAMLYININSGVELSTIQKAKPKLGAELCGYFARELEKPFFSQGVSLTAKQALKEEDLAMALQSMILMDDEYDGWKSLSVAECFQYADYLRGHAGSQKLHDFSEAIDYLGVFDKRVKYLRKNNVAPIVCLAGQLVHRGIKAGEYKDFLNGFFAGDNELYKSFSGSGNVKRANAEARYAILLQESYRHFHLGLPEGWVSPVAGTGSPMADGGGSGSPGEGSEGSGSPGVDSQGGSEGGVGNG